MEKEEVVAPLVALTLLGPKSRQPYRVTILRRHFSNKITNISLNLNLTQTFIRGNFSFGFNWPNSKGWKPFCNEILKNNEKYSPLPGKYPVYPRCKLLLWVFTICSQLLLGYIFIVKRENYTFPTDPNWCAPDLPTATCLSRAEYFWDCSSQCPYTTTC